MNAYRFNLNSITNRNTNMRLSIELQYLGGLFVLPNGMFVFIFSFGFAPSQDIFMYLYQNQAKLMIIVLAFIL